MNENNLTIEEIFDECERWRKVCDLHPKITSYGVENNQYTIELYPGFYRGTTLKEAFEKLLLSLREQASRVLERKIKHCNDALKDLHDNEKSAREDLETLLTAKQELERNMLNG